MKLGKICLMNRKIYYHKGIGFSPNSSIDLMEFQLKFPQEDFFNFIR